jgi:transposase
MNFNTRTSRVFAYPSPADLRKGFNGLYGLVVEGLDENPLSGDLFLFVNRNRNRAKILLWDGTGLCIFQKRLEQGRFAKLWRDTKKVTLSHSELSLFLEGCELIGSQKLSPDRVVF